MVLPAGYRLSGPVERPIGRAVPVTDPQTGASAAYLRLMFLKFRYQLGYESLCAEVRDSISWPRFRQIPLDAKGPHPAPLATPWGSPKLDELRPRRHMA